MKIIGIIFCLVGFATCAVILDRPRLNIYNVEGMRNAGIGRLYTMTREELLRQKFILDVLKQVELPLQNRDLNLEIHLDDIADENLYTGPLDNEMLFVLDLIRNNRMLGRNHICSMTDEQNLRQLIGLYRLMVRSRDYKTFQLLVIYARKNINPVLFVNALTLALADRLDTQMLIVPALYEILPRSYTDVSLILTVENVGAEDAIVNRNIGSIRPNIFDIIERGRQTRLAKLRSLENGYYGGIIDKSQLWMPWRDMHRQLALQKSLGGRVFIYDQGKQDVSVHLVSLGDSSNDQHQGLIAKDIGLRAFLNILLDELIVEQGNFLDSSTHQQSVHTSNIEYNTGNDLGRDDINDDIDISVRPSNQQNVEQDHVMNTDNKGKGMVNVIKIGGILVADGLKDLIGIAKSRIQNAKDHTVPHHTRQDGSLNNDVNIEPYKLQDWIKPVNTRDQDMPTNTDIPKNRENLDGRVMGENTHSILNQRQSTEERSSFNSQADWLSAHQYKDIINDRKSLDNDDLPTTSINSDSLLHAGAKRLQLLEGKQPLRNLDGKKRELYKIPNSVSGTNIVDEGVTDVLQRRYTDEDDWLNAHQANVVINDRKRLDDGLPMTSINSDRLLHISGRRLRLLEDQPIRSNIGYDNDKLAQRDRSHISNNRGLGVENDAKVDYKYKVAIHEHEQLDDDMPTTGRRLQLLQGKKQIHMQQQKSLEDTNIMDEDRIIQRVPRSLNRHLNDEHHRARINQLILYQLQQLVARLNIEQISLQNDDDDYDMLLNDHSKRIIVAKLNEISERLDQSMQQILSHLSQRQSYYDKLNVDDDVILQELDRVALGEILQEVVQLSEYVHGNQISNMLENSTTQLMLRHIVNTVERHMQTLKRNRKPEDIGCNAVNINNVKIDGLHTFVEEVDIDLTNLQGVAENDNKKKIIIGRVPRLNHKSFTINIDLTSDRNQRVIVRTLLIPKIDAKENQRSLDLQRHNTLLLDIVDVTLKVGRNSIKRKSRDITWTGRDVSSYTEIYERVLRTLRGDVDLTSDVIVGQTTLFPDRLLLPRGRVNGLPMQVLVVITPATTSGKDPSIHLNTSLGLDSLILDNLPIIYPMDRGVTDVNQMLALPNVFLKDVVIYHEDKISHMLN